MALRMVGYGHVKLPSGPSGQSSEKYLGRISSLIMKSPVNFPELVAALDRGPLAPYFNIIIALD